jgi:proton-translocating NADH-quinone oxidoreductase chain N
MRTVLLESLSAWWPETVLSVGALAVLLLGVWAPRAARPAAWAALAAAAATLLRVPAFPETATFFGLILCDPFSLAFRWLALGATALVLLMTAVSRDVPESVLGEYLALLLFVAVGLMLMAEANHLLMAYLAMELVSLSSYALVGLPNDARASEAALKYLLFGALASGIMLFGMSLLFGLTGRLGFPAIQQVVGGLAGPSAMALVAAVGLILVGLGFKISLVPFHQWTPDAYEGAPVPVAALLSVGPKAAGLALLVRLLEAVQPAWAAVVPALLVLTVVTMTLGNLTALVQTNVKRLLAYSTIAQVGYLLIGLVAGSALGREALLLYLVAYLVMNLGAFACVAVVVEATGSESLEAFRGLSQRAPALAACFSLFLLSLAGIPPLVGFIGKFLLFGSALRAGLTGLAVVAVLNSAAALYYYVNLIRLMYAAPAPAAAALRPAFPARVAVTVCAVGTLALGLFPDALLGFLRALSSLNLL